MINILFFLFCLVTSSTSHRVDGMQSTLEEDLKLARQIKLMNKPPIKSIHTKFGYIVDCIDIYKQPAFDHPLLKNHKLQRKPSFQRIGKTIVKNSPINPGFGLEKNQCPMGTVPIQRTTKDDLIRIESFLNDTMLTKAGPSLHDAKVTLENILGQPYYGVSGINSIYNPKVQMGQASISRMWVQNGPIDTLNKILIGWHVFPSLYNDYATHVYAAWTSDNFYKTGCFNSGCRGFVQTNNEYHLGGRFNQTSTSGGVTVECKFSIFQDPETKNWWLNVQNINIGYFPAALFSNLSSADQVGWGGRTMTTLGTYSPPMGSGYFPDKSMVHACYFREIGYQGGPDKYMADTYADRPDCFGVEYYEDRGREYGYSLEFGGPGGECGI